MNIRNKTIIIVMWLCVFSLSSCIQNDSLQERYEYSMLGVSDPAINDSMNDVEVYIKQSYSESTKISVEELMDSHYVICAYIKLCESMNDALYLRVDGLADYNDIAYYKLMLNGKSIYKYVLTEDDMRINDENLKTTANYATGTFVKSSKKGEIKHDGNIIHNGEVRVVVVDNDGNESNSVPLMLFDWEDGSSIDSLSIAGYPGFELEGLEP